ncbi:MAG: PAS domain S-box protein [Deltaproteobacteria bacterium]|nr:PAS domain S-box protein [Deltaproteobacteria bacterium]
MSLKLKLTLLIEGIVIILIIVTGFITTIREKETLESELRKRGLALASDLSSFMVRPLLSHDLPTIRRFVNQAMEQDYVRYVIILDPKGKVLMHNDLSEIGKNYRDRLSMAAVKSTRPGYTDIHIPKLEELHSDITMPIKVSDVRLGTIRLGYSHLAIQEQIKQAQRQIFIIGLLTTVGGGFIAYLLAIYISSPIRRITDVTEKVAQGLLDTQLRIDRNDEIGTLASAFNRMTEDLKKTTVSKDYFDNIIKSMNDILLVIGPDLKIRSANKAASELLEYTEDELIGMDAFLIFEEDSKFNCEMVLKNLSEKLGVANREADYITKTGKRIPVLLSASLLQDKTGSMEGVVCIARDVTEWKAVEDALRESEMELHFLSAQLMTAQEQERRRLSKELHDELGQSLMVLKLKLRSIQEGLPADRDTLRSKCTEAIEYINAVVENVRRLSRDLSPSVLEHLGLPAAIRWLVNDFCRHAKIDCTLDLPEMEGLFSQEEEIIIYRMIQESLTNIAKHALATEVSVIIEEKDDHAHFCIEDNGIGFDIREIFAQDSQRKGLGLSAMHERTRMLRGSLDIRSRKGNGTKISFTVPYHQGGNRN